jgi:hypothetical protein
MNQLGTDLRMQSVLPSGRLDCHPHHLRHVADDDQQHAWLHNIASQPFLLPQMDSSLRVSEVQDEKTVVQDMAQPVQKGFY